MAVADRRPLPPPPPPTPLLAATLKVARVTAGGETRGRREAERAEEEVGQPGFGREDLTFTQLLTSPVLFFFSLPFFFFLKLFVGIIFRHYPTRAAD